MIQALTTFFATEDLMPHGVCFLWRPELIWLHAVSDALIAASYYSIPFALVYFVVRRKDLVFPSVFLLFGLFILACGTTHLMAIWTLWRPDYWLDGAVKAMTAAASLGTAVIVWHIMPEALALPNRGDLARANRALERQIAERQEADATVRRLNAELEHRVESRTADLRAANERLSAGMHEKEVLLQELHHRVRNNLQVVSGLLSMQARIAAPALAPHFNESLERIHVMGRVHEQLYRTGDASVFDLGEYLRKLCRDVGDVYGASAAGVTCRVDAEPTRIGFDAATPLVLIVNEVLSNAFKHAFPEGRKGEIVIALRQSGGVVELTIADDGVGLPADHAERGRRSMGSRLIAILSEQIGATVGFAGGGGTRFTLTLPAAPGRDASASGVQGA